MTTISDSHRHWSEQKAKLLAHASLIVADGRGREAFPLILSAMRQEPHLLTIKVWRAVQAVTGKSDAWCKKVVSDTITNLGYGNKQPGQANFKWLLDGRTEGRTLSVFFLQLGLAKGYEPEVNPFLPETPGAKLKQPQNRHVRAERSADSSTPARATNASTGIRNIIRQKNGKYQVKIVRERATFSKKYDTIDEAKTAKKKALDRYLNKTPFWNSPIT